MFSLIKSALKSLELFLSLKNKKFYYELYQEHNDRQWQITEAIEQYRSSGDSNDADRADFLRQQLAAEREQFEHISAFYSKTE